MFSQCTSLVNVPHNLLPATTLADNCYSSMFYNCSSLVEAPELPAQTLVSNCYSSMFYGCSNLNYVLCAGTNASSVPTATEHWMTNVSANGMFAKAQASSWPSGDSGIPNGWDSFAYDQTR